MWLIKTTKVKKSNKNNSQILTLVRLKQVSTRALIVTTLTLTLASRKRKMKVNSRIKLIRTQKWMRMIKMRAKTIYHRSRAMVILRRMIKANRIRVLVIRWLYMI